MTVHDQDLNEVSGKSVVVSPLQWSELADIDAVDPIGDSDEACLAEIRDVLKKHAKLERLGVALLHSHFEMSDEEIIVETCDKVSRTLTSVVTKERAHGTLVPTILMLRDGDVREMMWCRQYCRRLLLGHGKDHDSV